MCGEALARTGVARSIGDWLVRQGGNSPGRLLVLLMLAVGFLGSVMSSTGVVAIFVPIVLRMAGRSGIAPGQLMVPMAYAALISGTMTPVATSPNLVINYELVRSGGDMAADVLVDALGDAGPHLILAALFAITVLLGMFIVNTANAVLLIPLALAAFSALRARSVRADAMVRTPGGDRSGDDAQMRLPPAVLATASAPMPSGRPGSAATTPLQESHMLYLDIPTNDDYADLAAWRGDMAVSIALPTTPVTGETDAGRIQLKNLARAAVDQLQAADADKRRLAALVEEIDDLIEDDAFWVHQAHGLVIYATPDNLRTFRVPNRLQPLVKVSDRFHLKPLLRSTTFCDTGYVLALADGGVRLIEVSKDLPAVEVKVPDLPTDAASAVGKRTIATRSYSGRIGGSEGQKVRLRQYARQVDTAVRAILAGRQEPLILASVDALDAIYRSVNSYPHLLETGLRGNPERQSPADLAAAARALLDALYRAQIADWHALYRRRLNEDRATTDLVRAARAATAGAVASLLVDMDQVVNGTVDEADGSVTFADQASAETYGVADEVARRALSTGGQVLSVRAADMPEPGSTVAAILRYPL